MPMQLNRQTDAGLLAMATNMQVLLNAEPTTYHVTAAQALVLQMATDAFAAVLAVWQTPTTRTPIARQDKQDGRERLLVQVKFLTSIITANPATTDAQRQALGIPVKKKPTPSPVPDVSPVIEFAGVTGRSVLVRLRTSGTTRAWPKGVRGGNVYQYVGATPPTEYSQWEFATFTGRTQTELIVPGDAATTLWVCANYVNGRGDTGPVCAPRSVNVAATAVMPKTALKIAA